METKNDISVINTDFKICRLNKKLLDILPRGDEIFVEILENLIPYHIGNNYQPELLSRNSDQIQSSFGLEEIYLSLLYPFEKFNSSQVKYCLILKYKLDPISLTININKKIQRPYQSNIIITRKGYYLIIPEINIKGFKLSTSPTKSSEPEAFCRRPENITINYLKKLLETPVIDNIYQSGLVKQRINKFNDIFEEASELIKKNYNINDRLFKIINNLKDKYKNKLLVSLSSNQKLININQKLNNENEIEISKYLLEIPNYPCRDNKKKIILPEAICLSAIGYFELHNYKNLKYFKYPKKLITNKSDFIIKNYFIVYLNNKSFVKITQYSLNPISNISDDQPEIVIHTITKNKSQYFHLTPEIGNLAILATMEHLKQNNISLKDFTKKKPKEIPNCLLAPILGAISNSY